MQERKREKIFNAFACNTYYCFNISRLERRQIFGNYITYILNALAYFLELILSNLRRFRKNVLKYLPEMYVIEKELSLSKFNSIIKFIFVPMYVKFLYHKTL